jgi:hypothetical protein
LLSRKNKAKNDTTAYFVSGQHKIEKYTFGFLDSFGLIFADFFVCGAFLVAKLC